MEGQAVFIVLAIAVAAVVMICGYYAAAQRRKELAAWARSRGFDFYPGKDGMLDERFGRFGCLCRGRSRYGYNRILGDWEGRELLAFDYRYVTGSGKNQQTHRFSAVVLQSRVPLKPLYLRPEGFFDKVTEFFGLDDIDFESAEFSRQFYVKSPDRRWAYDVIHQRAMDFLLRMPRFSIKFDVMHAVAWRDRRFGLQEFEQAAGVIAGLLDQLPEYLVRQQTNRGC
jgi:hypothetical protein